MLENDQVWGILVHFILYFSIHVEINLLRVIELIQFRAIVLNSEN